jgi:hypothetical protein
VISAILEPQRRDPDPEISEPSKSGSFTVNALGTAEPVDRDAQFAE